MRLLIAVLCALVLAPLRPASTSREMRWPGPTISIWNTTAYAVPVLDAERAWNASPAAVRFVPAADRATADVVVRYGAPHAQGQASVGYGPGTGSVTLPRGLGRMVSTTLAAHELGHVLGLGHENKWLHRDGRRRQGRRVRDVQDRHLQGDLALPRPA